MDEASAEISPEFAPPLLPIRRLHNYLYCPRLFYFQWVENLFEENADTVAGSHLHRNVDQPSKLEDLTTLGWKEGSRCRSLKLESSTLGLIGVVDLVEGGEEGAEIVDYKKGSARRTTEGERVAKEPDALQVAAQAMLLAEHGTVVTKGWIYYAADKRRVPVELGEAAFARVLETLAAARAVAESGQCPPPLRNDPRCLYCSAYPICLPNESHWWAQSTRNLKPDPQLHFPFSAPHDNEVEDRIVAALEFAASTQDKPPTLEPPLSAHDEREVLVVQKPGAQIGQRGEQLVVTVQGEEMRKLPGQQIRAIYCYGAVQVTAQAMQTCLELGIEVAYFSPAGRFLGMLTGLPASGVDARRGQYRLFDLPPVRLRLGQEIIRAKIHNQRVMVMRNGEPAVGVLKMMAALRDQVGETRELTELLGVEGSAAALYFEAFGSMLKDKSNKAFDWRGRNRRPPRDPVNALLSLGYSMLAKEITGVCYAVGLDPYMGFLHQPRYGRPALALDLMEEFRPLVADSVAVTLLNRGELGPEDFAHGATGTFLGERARKSFWEAWFRRMDTEVSHPEFGYKMSYRRMFEVQARQLWRYLRGEAREYHAFTTR